MSVSPVRVPCLSSSVRAGLRSQQMLHSVQIKFFLLSQFASYLLKFKLSVYVVVEFVCKNHYIDIVSS